LNKSDNIKIDFHSDKYKSFIQHQLSQNKFRNLQNIILGDKIKNKLSKKSFYYP
jgi:ABC-type lipoprotein release transport system permease subunit